MRDGLLVAEAESPADSYDGTLLIGAQRDADGNIFRISQTRVNHLSLYAGVMTEADIAAYDFAAAPLPPELVAESAAYTMPSAFVGNGSDRALDTGVKLYDVATKDWTLDTVIDVRKGVNNGVYMSCFSEETGHYRGFMLRQDNADTLTAYVWQSVCAPRWICRRARSCTSWSSNPAVSTRFGRMVSLSSASKAPAITTTRRSSWRTARCGRKPVPLLERGHPDAEHYGRRAV